MPKAGGDRSSRTFGKHMIVFRHTMRGLMMAGVFMVLSYIVFWLLDVLIFGGDYDALGLFALPVAACVYGALAFGVIIFPIAHLAKMIANRYQAQRVTGALIGAALCGAVGIGFGAFGGSAIACLMYFIYGAGAGYIFFMTAIERSEGEL